MWCGDSETLTHFYQARRHQIPHTKQWEKSDPMKPLQHQYQRSPTSKEKLEFNIISFLMSLVSLCTAHNTHAALQSHSALHTTHMPLYSLTLHCTKHTCRSTVSLRTAHNTHAALQSHSALHTTHMPLNSLTSHCTQHTCLSTTCCHIT